MFIEKELLFKEINSIQEFSIDEVKRVYNYCIDLANKLLIRDPHYSDLPHTSFINNAQSHYLFFDITLNYIFSQISNYYQYLTIPDCCLLYDSLSNSYHASDTKNLFKYHIKKFEQNCPEIYEYLLKNKLILPTGKSTVKICHTWGDVIYSLINDFFQGNVPTLSLSSNYSDMEHAIELIDKLAKSCSYKSLFHFHIEREYSLTLYLDTLMTFCRCYKNKTNAELITSFLSNLKYISLIDLPNYRLYIADVYKQLHYSNQPNKALDLHTVFFPAILLDFLFTYALNELNNKFDMVNNDAFINELEKSFNRPSTYTSIYHTIQSYDCLTFIQEICRILKNEYKQFLYENQLYFNINNNKHVSSLTKTDFKQISSLLNNINMQPANSFASLYHLEKEISVLLK